MKKVIFIGGTSYSGSTMLDMILANDPRGYSLGEIVAIFRPWRRHHHEEIERIKGDPIWGEIYRQGERELYANLFEKFPWIDFFVDSSKNPFWISSQMKYLISHGIDYENVLIYKSPQELAHSFARRGKLSRLKKSVGSYYKLYLYLIREFIAISYKQVVLDDEPLISLCELLGIGYFAGKKEFWRKAHSTFFGNNRARIHVDNLRIMGSEKLTLLDKNGTRRLYYQAPEDSYLISVGDEIQKEFKGIYNFLCSTKKIGRVCVQDMPVSRLWVLIKKIEYNTRWALAKNVALLTR